MPQRHEFRSWLRRGPRWVPGRAERVWMLGAVLTVAGILLASSTLPSNDVGEAYAPLLMVVVISVALIGWTGLWAVGMILIGLLRDTARHQPPPCPDCGHKTFDGRSCTWCGFDAK